MSLKLLFVALLAGCLWPVAGLTQSLFDPETSLRIGLRADAAPFAYISGSAQNVRSLTRDSILPKSIEFNGDIYEGYVIQICAAALARMRDVSGVGFTFERVTALNRMEQLDSGAIDVLCDPATITQSRLSAPDVTVSVPIYLSGIGFAKNELNRMVFPHWPCQGHLVGLVEATTADVDGIQRVLDGDGIAPSYVDALAKFIGLRTAGTEAINAWAAEQYQRCIDNPNVSRPVEAPAENPDWASSDKEIVRVYDTHTDLAEAFCAREVYYYVGDIEIVLRTLRNYTDRNPGIDCPHTVSDKTYSSERYGIFMHFTPGEPARMAAMLAFQQALNQEIHRGRDSILVTAFREHFDAQKISRALDLFFWSVVSDDG
ncbi:MAG: transporter substrate-binding domain-containing protein [Pseudomonadota bacterium]